MTSLTPELDKLEAEENIKDSVCNDYFAAINDVREIGIVEKSVIKEIFSFINNEIFKLDNFNASHGQREMITRNQINDIILEAKSKLGLGDEK